MPCTAAIGVQLGDGGSDVGLLHACGQFDGAVGGADTLAGLVDRAGVPGRGFVVADTQHSQPGRSTMFGGKSGKLLLEVVTDGLGQRLAVQ